MDARDLCRRLNCSPITLSAWVDHGCPVHRDPPYASYRLDEVRQWLDDQNITDWPRESDYDLDSPMRVLLKALEHREITPWQAEKIIVNLGSGFWAL